MFFDLGSRTFILCNILRWLMLFLVAESANTSGGQVVGRISSKPRLLPRDKLLRLPIAARDVGAELLVRTDSGNVTVNATQSLTANSSAGISAISQGKDRQSFYAPIEIGDINFRVVVDTGSSDLWILSSACEMKACESQPRYPLGFQSPSFQSVNGNTTVYSSSYADGTSVSGIVAKETVEVAGLTVANQTFGLISNSNVSMNDQESGILGLGFPRLSRISTQDVNDSKPFFANLAEQGLLDYPLFGISLTRNLTGSLSLGAIDASIVTDPQNISWNDVAQFSPLSTESNTSSYLHWAISLTSFSVNGTQMAPLPSQARATGNTSLALFDVGTPGLYGTYSDVSRLYGLIAGARLVDAARGQWVVPCDINVPISLTFGSDEYVLQPSDYLIGPASSNPSSCFSWPRALPPGVDGIDWQIGTAFLQTVYTIFSYGISTKEPPKIGLYHLKNLSVTVNTSSPVQSQSSASFTPQTTIQAVLPNSLMSTPTFATPLYAFNTSIPASIGGIVQSGLATSTYRAILPHAHATTGFHGSAIPTISPSPSIIIITTDGVTTTSTLSASAVHFGIPPGWSSAQRTQSVGMILAVILGAQLILVCDLLPTPW